MSINLPTLPILGCDREVFMAKEKECKGVYLLEDLLEKKTKIYSRLLTDPFLAEEMELLSVRHAERKKKWLGEEEDEQ